MIFIPFVRATQATEKQEPHLPLWREMRFSWLVIKKRGLLAEAKLLDNLTIAVDVLALQIVQKCAALAYQLR